MTRENLVYPRQINIRLTDEQAAALERRALAEDRSISGLVRRTLDRAGIFLSEDESNSLLGRENGAEAGMPADQERGSVAGIAGGGE